MIKNRFTDPQEKKYFDMLRNGCSNEDDLQQCRLDETEHDVVSERLLSASEKKSAQTEDVDSSDKVHAMEHISNLLKEKNIHIDELVQYEKNNEQSNEQNRKGEDKQSSESPESTQPTESTMIPDPKYEKYFKMKKVGIPLPAIKNKISLEGLDPSIIDMDSCPLVPQSNQSSESSQPPPTIPSNLPKNNPQPTPINSNDTPSQPTQNPPETPSFTLPPKEKVHVDVKLRALYWNPVKPQTIKENSLWLKMNDKDVDIEMKNLVQCFSSEKSKESKPIESQHKETEEKKQVIVLTSEKRQRNVGIVLNRFKLSNQEIEDYIYRHDMTFFTSDVLESFRSILPTTEEVPALMAYQGDLQRLSEVDQFLYAMAHIPNVNNRIKSMSIQANWEANTEEISIKLNSIINVLKQIETNQKLLDLLTYVLAVGNSLNGILLHSLFIS